jgi:hypothetical protein
MGTAVFWEEPLIYIPEGLAKFAAVHNTSPVIAYAIFEMTADAVEEERVWGRPTQVEVRTVVRRAWQLAERDQEAIYWNGRAYTRNIIEQARSPAVAIRAS